MRTCIIGLFLLAIAAGGASAQDTRPKTSAGDRALLFSFNGFGDFGVNGSTAGSAPLTFFGIDTTFNIRLLSPIYGFGIKYYLGDNVALRASLGLGSSTVSIPRSEDTTGRTDDVTDLILGVTPGLEFHLVNTGPVTAYTGIFASFSGSWNFSGDKEDTIADSTTRSYSSFGGGAVFGVEYFPWNSISLGAEYQLGVSVSSSSTEHKGESTDGPGYFDIGIGAFAVQLGVYF